MEEFNVIINNNIGIIVVVLAVLLLVETVVLVKSRGQVKALQEKYDYFTKGEAVNIDQLLTASLEQLEGQQKQLKSLEEKHQQLQEQVNSCLQVVRLKRYDAYQGMGGEFSYSLYLGNAKADGILLTSIYGREDSRSYAKKVEGGRSLTPLGEEEKELL